MKNAPTEPSELESELHSANHIPCRGLVLSLRGIASKGRHDIVSFDFGSAAGEKTAPYLCMVDHVSGAVSAILTGKAVRVTT